MSALLLWVYNRGRGMTMHKIGLALGGDGAKGYAHINVIKISVA